MSYMSQSHSAFQNTDLSTVKEERYVFRTEWFDKQAELLRPYLFTFYPKDCSAEMVSWTPIILIFETVRYQAKKILHEKNGHWEHHF